MTGPSPPADDAVPPVHVVVTLTREAAPEKPQPGALSAIDGFFKSSLGVALLTLLTTGVVGGLVSNHFTDEQRRAAEEARRIADLEIRRSDLIEAFSKTYEARRTAVALVRSTIEDGGKAAEREARWKAYQEAYLAYNLNGFAFRASMIDYLGYGTSQLFRPSLDLMTSSFSRLDACLTKAYRLDVAGKRRDAKALLRHCRGDGPGALEWTALQETKKLNDCLSTVEIELTSSLYLENKFARLEKAAQEVKSVRLVDDPAKPRVQAPRAAGNRPAGRPPVLTPSVKVFKIADLTAKDWSRRKCAKLTDWVCQRLYNRHAVKAKLAVEACASLADKRYGAASSTVALAGPSPARGAARKS
ncbi:hypothetical protein [Caulobacter sp. CCG-8]|uniref:hypothetical protein n=1 Tax=Caulobacter sp. CCG-8 TaxID=3127958 RepID=UPI00307E5B0F